MNYEFYIVKSGKWTKMQAMCSNYAMFDSLDIAYQGKLIEDV